MTHWSAADWFLKYGKDATKGTKERGDFLHIGQAILKESEARLKNVAMAWVDNKKVYDMS